MNPRPSVSSEQGDGSMVPDSREGGFPADREGSQLAIGGWMPFCTKKSKKTVNVNGMAREMTECGSQCGIYHMVGEKWEMLIMKVSARLWRMLRIQLQGLNFE